MVETCIRQNSSWPIVSILVPLTLLGEYKGSEIRDKQIGQGVTWEVKLTGHNDVLNIVDKEQEGGISDNYIGSQLL